MTRVDFDSSGADAALDGLMATAHGAVRPAAQAAAQVLYEEARARCPVSDHACFFYGKNSKKSGVRCYFEPGSLRDSIYQAFSKDNSSEFRGGYRNVTYHIAWNHRKVPYGHTVEFGTRERPSLPEAGIRSKSADGAGRIARGLCETAEGAGARHHLAALALALALAPPHQDGWTRPRRYNCSCRFLIITKVRFKSRTASTISNCCGAFSARREVCSSSKWLPVTARLSPASLLRASPSTAWSAYTSERPLIRMPRSCKSILSLSSCPMFRSHVWYPRAQERISSRSSDRVSVILIRTSRRVFSLSRRSVSLWTTYHPAAMTTACPSQVRNELSEATVSV